jgi:hypothetical protein
MKGAPPLKENKHFSESIRTKQMINSYCSVRQNKTNGESTKKCI